MVPAGVVVVGSYNEDRVWDIDALPAPGETRIGARFRSGPGGKGFNQAVASARQGARTVFIAALGDDAMAEAARALAVSEGLDARFATIEGASTGCAGLWVDANGRNSIVVAEGANAGLTAAHVAGHAAALRDAAVVLAPLESPLDAVAAAFRFAREGRAITLLNPAPVVFALDAGLLALADALTPNETEFALLLERFAGIEVNPDSLAALPDEALTALCAQLPVPALLMTLGAGGVFAAPGSHAGGRLTLSAGSWRFTALKVHAVDTTGAGDAFNGALAAALAESPEAGLERAIPRAIAVASLSTERRGAALSVPRRADVYADPRVMQRHN